MKLECFLIHLFFNPTHLLIEHVGLIWKEKPAGYYGLSMVSERDGRCKRLEFMCTSVTGVRRDCHRKKTEFRGNG